MASDSIPLRGISLREVLFLQCLVGLEELNCLMFGDALLALLPKVIGFCLNVPSSTLILSNLYQGKRGWAICFSAQFYPTPTFRAKSADFGMPAGRKASVACILSTIGVHRELVRIGLHPF